MDNEDMLSRISKKISPQSIRSTLMFSALLQLTHELIKYSVVVEVKKFFGFSDLFGEEKWLYGDASEARYKRTVLTLAPNNKVFEASSIWLEQAGAISEEQRARLSAIYSYRHELTHEMAGFLVDVERQTDDSILIDALQIARDIDRFWLGIQKDIGTFDDHGDVDIDSVVSGPAMILQLGVAAYLSSENSGDHRHASESRAPGSEHERPRDDVRY